MPYILSESCGDSISVPQLVFSKLKDKEENLIRVALLIVATKCTDSSFIARELRLKSPKEAKDAMLFWKGAGLLKDCDCVETVLNEAPRAIRAPKLTSREISIASQTDANIAALLQTSQAILGSVISENDANEIVSLYICNELPVELILMGISHFAALGKRNGRYIARALLSWQEQGIDTAEACERYLLTLEKRAEREMDIAVLFEIPNAKFTKLESSLIAEWFEGFGFDYSMISEAIQYASDKKTVKYVNGILRSWYSKGFKTAKDVQSDSVNSMKNVQPQSPKTFQRDILQNSVGKIPVYKKPGDV